MAKIISPSLLSADFTNLAKDIEMLNESEAEWIHLDIMDGVFVPNISFGLPVVKQLRGLTNKVLDTHLMIVEPDKYVDQFAEAGADIINVHYEACPHLHRTIQHIKNKGKKAAVTLNPATPVAMLEDIVEEVDMVLLMSVNPGFGGQSFIENTYNKVKELKALIEKHHSAALIEIDGGVNAENAAALFEAGADVLVAGNYVFSAKDKKAAIARLKE